MGAIALTLLVAAAAFNTGTNLLYLIFSMLLGAGVISVIYGRGNVSRLRLTLSLPAETHCDAPTHGGIKLTSLRHRMWNYGLAARAKAPEIETGLLSAFFLSIPAGQTRSRTVEPKFTRRGLVRFEQLEISSSFPFGFVHYHVRLPERTEVLVLPRLLPIQSIIKNNPGMLLGSNEVPFKGQGSSLFSIRDYMSGDPARSIHWKLSSKGSGLKVREFEREESQKTLIILDHALAGPPDEEAARLFEKSISIAASLSKFLIEKDGEVALWTAMGSIPMGSARRHLHRIMRALALLDIGDFIRNEASPPKGNSSLRIWIGTGPDPAGGQGAGDIRIDPTRVPDIQAAEIDQAREPTGEETR